MTTGFDPAGQAVLVTGCSSGIGRATARRLADKGFTVFATVRTQQHADELAGLSLPGLIPVAPLDLADPAQVAATAEKIREELAARGLAGLRGIVNNAGAGPVSPIEALDLRQLRTELEARIVGPLALLQALLPLLRAGGGRVIWIATPSLTPIPYVSSIHACDFAVNCFARTLSIELMPWSIPSVFVRCGGIRTAAPARNDRELREAMGQWSAELRELYGETMRREMESLASFDAHRSDPDDVAERAWRALSDERPRRVYRVGYLSGMAAVLDLLPQSWVDAIMRRRSSPRGSPRS